MILAGSAEIKLWLGAHVPEELRDVLPLIWGELERAKVPQQVVGIPAEGLDDKSLRFDVAHGWQDII